MNPSDERPHHYHAINLALFIARMTVGIIFVAHGSQKLFGAFDGPGLGKIVEMMGNPGYFVAAGEFFGGLGLIAGLLSRVAGLGIVVIMIGALVMVHGENGFFLSDNGYEYVLSLIALALTIVLAGPGRFALVRLVPRHPCWLE